MPTQQLASAARRLLSLRSVKAAPCMAPRMVCPRWAPAGLGSGQGTAPACGHAHHGPDRGFASCAAAPGRASTLHADSPAHGQQPTLGWPPSGAPDPGDAAPSRAHASAALPEPRAHSPPAPAGRDAAGAAGRAEGLGRPAVQRGEQAGARLPGASVRPEPAAAADGGPLGTGAAPAAAAQARPGSLGGAPRPEPGWAAAAAASAPKAGAAQRRDLTPQVGGNGAADGARAPASSGDEAMPALGQPRSLSAGRAMLAGQVAPGANGAAPASGPGEQGPDSAGSHAAASNGAFGAHRAAAHSTYICELRLRYERGLSPAHVRSSLLAKHSLPLLLHLAVSSSCALHGSQCRPTSLYGTWGTVASFGALATPNKQGRAGAARRRNFALVEDETVALGPGLNVITGESGAGKSVRCASPRRVRRARACPRPTPYPNPRTTQHVQRARLYPRPNPLPYPWATQHARRAQPCFRLAAAAAQSAARAAHGPRVRRGEL